jgi:hypothetical protein
VTGKVYSRQYRTGRWNRSNTHVHVEGHDALEALEEAVPEYKREGKVRWWLVEDAYGYLHEIRLDDGVFSYLNE